MYSTLIAIVLRPSSSIVDFFKFYDRPVDIQIWAFLKEVNVELLRPVGLLFIKMNSWMIMDFSFNKVSKVQKVNIKMKYSLRILE